MTQNTAITGCHWLSLRCKQHLYDAAVPVGERASNWKKSQGQGYQASKPSHHLQTSFDLVSGKPIYGRFNTTTGCMLHGCKYAHVCHSCFKAHSDQTHKQLATPTTPTAPQNSYKLKCQAHQNPSPTPQKLGHVGNSTSAWPRQKLYSKQYQQWFFFLIDRSQSACCLSPKQSVITAPPHQALSWSQNQ